MSRASPQNLLLHILPTDPPRRITGGLFWLVHCPEHLGSNDKCFAYALTSMIISDRIRSCPDLPDLSTSTLLS